MSQEKDLENRAFEEMRMVALKRLEGKDPLKIAKRTGIPFDPESQKFILNTLGQTVEIYFPDYEIRTPLDPWHHLLVLHYLDQADGSELYGQWIPFGDLPGGMARGGDFDRKSEGELSNRLGNRTYESVERACQALGGKVIPSNADVCGVIPLFPRYPIAIKLWFADEELPGSGRVFLDKSAEHYLSVEDAVVAGTILLQALFQEESRR